MLEGPHVKKERPLSNHLKVGEKPIMACLGTPYNYSISSYMSEFPDGSNLSSTQNIDFYDSTSSLEEKNFLNAGSQTYVISTIDNKDKFSNQFLNCTGLVVIGKEKTTGKNVSFLTHQNPWKFLHKNKDDFVKHLHKRLKEIQEMCEEGTIDAVLIGGSYFQSDPKDIQEDWKKAYLDSIELISKEVDDVLKFEPIVINGPKTHDPVFTMTLDTTYPDRIYFDNKNRRLYFMREKINSDTKDFHGSDIIKETDKWE